MRAVLILLLFLAPLPAWAERAILIADTLRLTNSDLLEAVDNVEITYQGNRLNARRVTYDQNQNRLLIEGPFTLDTGDQILVMADAADLSADMQNGIIQGARMVMSQRMQVTAAEMQRVDGRYRVLRSVAASSCQICTNSSVPLWEIRATRVIHDEVEKQMYFDNAQFRLGGVPVLYLPRLRLPDPTLKRATGFLTPRLSVNTAVGVGIKIPYFVTLGKHADLTVTPFVSNQNSRNVSLRYRQAYRTGNIEVTGTYGRDNVLSDNRFYGIITGGFDLPRDYKLTLRAETVSDSAYFQSYGLTEKDRLVTFGQITRSNRDTTVNARILGTQSIRATESNATQPSLIGDADFQHRYDLGDWGDASFGVAAHARQRGSSDPLDGNDPDTNADGRDVLGFGIRGSWQKNLTLPFGILGALQSELRADSYRVAQDAIYQGSYGRLHAAVGAELRWPLVKVSANNITQTIEPIGQIVVTPKSSPRLFNEDSSLVEFDQGNLFALSRFPGSETVEDGIRLNLGVTYSRAQAATQDHGARLLAISFGRVLRAEDLHQFSQASGLDGARSDWLAATQIDFGGAYTLTGRVLFDDGLAPTKTELRASAKGARNSATVGFLFAPADLDEGRSQKISELTLSTAHDLTANWSARLGSRYDFISNNTAKGNLGLVYRNECLLVDVSLSRSFATSTNVKPSTDFGLSIEFLGFGGGDAGAAEQCRG